MTIRIRLGGDDHDKLFTGTFESKKLAEKPRTKASLGQKVTRLSHAGDVVMTKLNRLSHFCRALWHGKLEWVNNKSQLELLQRTFRTLGDDLKKLQRRTESEPIDRVGIRYYTKAIEDARYVIEVLKGAKADQAEIEKIEGTINELDEAVKKLASVLQLEPIIPTSGGFPALPRRAQAKKAAARPQEPGPTPKPGHAFSQVVARAKTPAAPAAAKRLKTPIASRPKTPLTKPAVLQAPTLVRPKAPARHKEFAKEKARPTTSDVRTVGKRGEHAPATREEAAEFDKAAKTQAKALPPKTPSPKVAPSPKIVAKPLKTPDGSSHHVVPLPPEMPSTLVRMEKPPQTSEAFDQFLLQGGKKGQNVSLSHPLFSTFIQENYGEDVLRQGIENFQTATFNLRLSHEGIRVLLPEVAREKRKGWLIPIAKKAPPMLEDKEAADGVAEGAAKTPKPKEKSEEQRETRGFTGRRGVIAFGMALLGASGLAATGTALGPSLFAAGTPQVEMKPFFEGSLEAAHGTHTNRTITAMHPPTFERVAEQPSHTQAPFSTMPPQIAPPPPRTIDPSTRLPLGSTPEMQPEEPSWGPIETAVRVGGAAVVLGTAIGVACLFGRPKAGAPISEGLSTVRTQRAQELTENRMTDLSRAVRLNEIEDAEKRELRLIGHRDRSIQRTFNIAQIRHNDRKVAFERKIVGEGHEFDLNRLTGAQFSQWEKGMLASLDALRNDVQGLGVGPFPLSVQKRYHATIDMRVSTEEWRVELYNLQKMAGMEAFCSEALKELEKHLNTFAGGSRDVHEPDTIEIKMWNEGLNAIMMKQRKDAQPALEEAMRLRAQTSAPAETLQPQEGSALVRRADGSTVEFRPNSSFISFASKLVPGEQKRVAFSEPDFLRIVEDSFPGVLPQVFEIELAQGKVGRQEFIFSRSKENPGVVQLTMPDIGRGSSTVELRLNPEDLLGAS